jgi:hypothetical protein
MAADSTDPIFARHLKAGIYRAGARGPRGITLVEYQEPHSVRLAVKSETESTAHSVTTEVGTPGLS